mgnify:CR=1 FL=1
MVRSLRLFFSMGARCILLRAKSFGMTRMAGIFATVDTTKFLANVLVSPPSVPKRMILCGFHYLQLHGTVGYDTFAHIPRFPGPAVRPSAGARPLLSVGSDDG